MPQVPVSRAELQETVDVRARSKSHEEAAAELGLAASTVRRRLILAREQGIEPSRKVAETAPAPSPLVVASTISETELRSRIDPSYRIEQAAVTLVDGQYITESDFLVSVGLKSRVSRTVLEREQFAAFRGRADNGVVYWGHPDGIRRMREANLLR